MENPRGMTSGNANDKMHLTRPKYSSRTGHEQKTFPTFCLIIGSLMSRARSSLLVKLLMQFQLCLKPTVTRVVKLIFDPSHSALVIQDNITTRNAAGSGTLWPSVEARDGWAISAAGSICEAQYRGRSNRGWSRLTSKSVETKPLLSHGKWGIRYAFDEG